MPSLTPEIANEILESRKDAVEFLKEDGREHRQYGYRYQFQHQSKQHICIKRPGPAKGITVYINLRSCSGENFPVSAAGEFFEGVSVIKEYPKGYSGENGRPGVSTVVVSCPTLNPRD